jgi:acid phosphatase
MIAGAANFPGDTYAVNTTTPFNVTGDSGDESIDIWNVDTIVDLLVPAGLTYKVYAQDYPTSGKCFLADGFGTEPITNLTDELYRRKHNPFISFKTFTDSEIRCSTQMDFTHLYEDLASGDIADFSYIIPDLLSDDHDSSINYTAAWLDKFVEDLYQSPAFMEYRVLVHINYDEDDYGYTYYYNGQYFDNGTANPYYNATCAAMGLFCPPEGCTNLLNCTLDQTNNKVYSALLGSAIPSQSVDMSDHTYYDHYSILATVEENWGLGNLGRNDVTANPFKLTATAGARRGLKGSA